MTAKLIQLSQKTGKYPRNFWINNGTSETERKTQRAEILLDLILQSEAATIGEESKLLYINQEPTSVQVSKFLYGLKQPNKKMVNQNTPKF